jgi:hypothetical protein
MSRKPETTFIGSVSRHLPAALYRMHTHNPYIGGIPDMWYSGVLADIWIEYKFVILPKKLTTLITPTLSPLQLEWLTDRHDEGRKCSVIVGCKEGGVILDHKEWEASISAERFMQRLLSRQDIASWIVKHTGEPP